MAWLIFDTMLKIQANREVICVLTHQEIVRKLRNASTNKHDIECINEFTVDFYTLFGLSRHPFHEEKLKNAFKELVLLTHPDKGNYPNRQALMQYINNARDTLQDPSERSAYDKTLPRLSQESSKPTEQEEENSCEYRSESPFNIGHTGPMSCYGMFTPRESSFPSGLNPCVPPRNSDTQNGYLMFFCITNGAQEDRHAKASELIKKYVEKKKSGTGHLFHNNQLSNKTETVTFGFSRITEYQFDDAEENFLVITLSTKEITLNDALIKSASCLYTKEHPECKTSVAQKSSFSCCL